MAQPLLTFRVSQLDHVLFSKFACAVIEALQRPDPLVQFQNLFVELLSKLKDEETFRQLLNNPARVVLGTLLEYLPKLMQGTVNDYLNANPVTRDKALNFYGQLQAHFRGEIARMAQDPNSKHQPMALRYLKGGKVAA